jgi:uncharacterized short protein YbdD (DUF466 family)
MVIKSDESVGRMMWLLMHIIAANCPDGDKQGLTEQRLRGYYDFFKSLGHVLPRASWRDTWRRVTTAGRTTELVWDTFRTIKNHHQLSKWLFVVHDTVRHQLNQKPAASYKTLNDTYRKYRENARVNAKNRAEDPTGFQKLRGMLKSRPTAMDDYLRHMHGDEFGRWTSARKRAARTSHLDQAAVWYWDKLSNAAARVDQSFDGLNVARRRNRILKDFVFKYRLRHERIMNVITTLPGNIKNRILR